MTIDSRLQLARNIEAFNSERVNWPDKSRASWLSDILDLADMAEVRVTIDLSGFLHSDNLRPCGDQNCHRFPSVESTGDKKCQSPVTKIVTSGTDRTLNSR
jgi:hypothetical protein